MARRHSRYLNSCLHIYMPTLLCLAQELLEEKVRPYIHADGGDIHFVRFDRASGVVSVPSRGLTPGLVVLPSSRCSLVSCFYYRSTGFLVFFLLALSCTKSRSGAALRSSTSVRKEHWLMRRPVVCVSVCRCIWRCWGRVRRAPRRPSRSSSWYAPGFRVTSWLYSMFHITSVCGGLLTFNGSASLGCLALGYSMCPMFFVLYRVSGAESAGALFRGAGAGRRISGSRERRLSAEWRRGGQGGLRL